MALNAKPIILWDNLFNRSTPTATDTATGFDPLNLIDWRRHTLWKGASAGTKHLVVDLNKTLNAGFETGDLTNWTPNDAAASNTNPNSGTWASRMVASGSDQDGAESAKITVDPAKTYRLKIQHDVTWTAGDYKLKLHFYDSGDNLISTTTLVTRTATTGTYVEESNSIGPSGSDVVFPAGTASIAVQDTWDDTPTGTSDMDDVIFYEEVDPDRWAMVNHNFWSANATVSLESSVADTEVIGATWVERVAGFTPPDNKAIWKPFTAIGTPQRAWRIKIVTANLAAFLGMIFLGEKLEFPKYMLGEWDPQPYTVRGTTGMSEGGNWLGATPQPFVSQNTLFMQNITDAFVRDTFGPVFDDHIRQLLPWMLVWDETNHDADVFLMSLRDGAQKSFPYTPTLRAITLEVNTVVEE